MFGSFEWFIGVIEDRMDPEKMNRVKVRCFGFHTENKSVLPTEDLPWATVMMPATAAGTSGIFDFPHGLVEGSWVVGFFRDGNQCQDPVVMGSIAAKYIEKPDNNKGFSDPNGVYPKDEYVGFSDVNEHAREDSSSVVTIKKDTVTRDVPNATGGTWSEPETPFAPVYPFNKVRESERGHLQEVDDTEGAERLHEYHTAGTFREVHPDGSVVHRIVKDKYEIVLGDEFVNVKGNVQLTIDANCQTYIKGDWDIKVDGNLTQTIGGILQENVSGDVIENYSSNQTSSVSGDVSETFGGNQTTNASGDIDIDATNIFLN